MKKKQILVLSIIALSLFIIPSALSKTEDNPFDQLWVAVNDLINRVTVLEVTGGSPDLSEIEARLDALEAVEIPDCSELEVMIEALEVENELQNVEIESLEARVTELELTINLPPIITLTGGDWSDELYQGILYTFEWTVIDPEGDDFTGFIHFHPELAHDTFTQSISPIYTFSTSFSQEGLQTVNIEATDEHGETSYLEVLLSIFP